jgi:hypothetical protein
MGFNKLFWGFVFLFDLRIGGLDILPDFVAYILFYQGLSILAVRSEYFEKARKFAFPLIFISILDVYQITVTINEFNNNPFGLFGIIMGLVLLIVNMLLVYNICLGIAEGARKINDSELEMKAMNRWKLYLVINIVLIVGMIAPFLLAMLFIVILVASITSYLLMLGLMKTASYKLEQTYPGGRITGDGNF